MATSNAKLLHRLFRKTFGTGAYVDDNGHLNPKYVLTYMNYMRSEARPLMAKVVQRRSTQMSERIAKRYMGEPITQKAPEADRLVLDVDTNKPQIGGTVHIENKKFRARIWMSDEIQYNAVDEKRVFAETMNFVMERHAVDRELLLVNGNEAITGSGPWYELYRTNDGLVKLTEDANLIDGGAQLLDFDLLAELWETMPDFLKDAPGMQWIWSPSATMRLARFLQNMQTTVGNDALEKRIPRPYGIPYIECSAIPRTLSITGQAVDTAPEVISTRVGPYRLLSTAKNLKLNIDALGDVEVDLLDGGSSEDSYFARTICRLINDAVSGDGAYDATYAHVAVPLGNGGIKLTSPTDGSGGSVQVVAASGNDAKGVLGFSAATTSGANGATNDGVTKDGTIIWLVNPANIINTTLGDIKMDERWDEDADSTKFTIYGYGDTVIQEMDMVGRANNVRV